MRIVFQNLNPSPDELSEEDLAVLEAAALVAEGRPGVRPYFVTSIESSPFVVAVAERGWDYELVADNAQYVSTAEIDALVSRTWSRAKKKYDFDRSAAQPAAVVQKSSAAALKKAQQQIDALRESREYQVGSALLKPLRAVRRLGSSKAKS